MQKSSCSIQDLVLFHGSVWAALIFSCQHFAEWLQLEQDLSDKKHTGTLWSLLALFHAFLKIISTTPVS